MEATVGNYGALATTQAFACIYQALPLHSAPVRPQVGVPWPSFLSTILSHSFSWISVAQQRLHGPLQRNSPRILAVIPIGGKNVLHVAASIVSMGACRVHKAQQCVGGRRPQTRLQSNVALAFAARWWVVARVTGVRQERWLR